MLKFENAGNYVRVWIFFFFFNILRKKKLPLSSRAKDSTFPQETLTHFLSCKEGIVLGSETMLSQSSPRPNLPYSERPSE